MDRRQLIREHIALLATEHGHTDPIRDDESLILSGLLDSLAVVQIVVFMEQTFEIDFSAVFFDQNDFDSIDAMVAFVNLNAP